MNRSVYSSSPDSLEELAQLRSKASMRSESKPSKPPPSDTKLSEDATDGGCRRLRPEVWDVPPASADATAVAASAAAATGEEGRAAGAAAGDKVMSTVV